MSLSLIALWLILRNSELTTEKKAEDIRTHHPSNSKTHQHINKLINSKTNKLINSWTQKANKLKN